MTDLEKELVEKLPKALRIALDKPYSTFNDYIWNVQQELLPLIHSHTQALVARATNLIAQVRDDYHSNDGPFDMGMRLQMLENEVCSLTPADAARELERREESVRADTIIRFRKVLDRLDIHGYSIGMAGEFGATNSQVVARLRELESQEDQCRQYIQHAQEREHEINVLRERIASFEAQAKEKP